MEEAPQEPAGRGGAVPEEMPMPVPPAPPAGPARPRRRSRASGGRARRPPPGHAAEPTVGFRRSSRACALRAPQQAGPRPSGRERRRQSRPSNPPEPSRLPLTAAGRGRLAS